jgi:hypothetical protein
MPKVKRDRFKWLERMNASQLKYAAKRIGVEWVGKERLELVRDIRDDPGRFELREPDVRNLLPTWEQLYDEIDWQRSGWNYDWHAVRRDGLRWDWPSHLRFAATSETSRMMFARDALKKKWANMRIPKEESEWTREWGATRY